LEFIGGLFSNSVAILSDALHDLGDSLALALAWFLERKAEGLKPTKDYSYGFARLRLMGALLNSLILVLGSVFILIEAISRFEHQIEPQADLMLIMALVGLFFNGIAFYRLEGGSLNQKMVRMHLLEDILGWLAVLIGSILLQFTDWYFIDPLLSVVISLYILKGVYHRLKETVDLLLQKVPAGLSLAEIESRLLAHQKVKGLHHVHLWSLDGHQHVLTAHIQISETVGVKELDALRKELIQALEGFNLSHHTLQFEYQSASCED